MLYPVAEVPQEKKIFNLPYRNFCSQATLYS